MPLGLLIGLCFGSAHGFSCFRLPVRRGNPSKGYTHLPWAALVPQCCPNLLKPNAFWSGPTYTPCPSDVKTRRAPYRAKDFFTHPLLLWAAIFIWGALVLLARASNFETNLNGWDGWAVFLTGTGVIVLLKSVLRLLIPEHRRAWVGDLTCGLILLGFGLGDRVNWSWVWPVLLITIGLIILRRTLQRRS